MKKLFLLLAMFAASVFSLGADCTQGFLPIIPQPLSVELNDGGYRTGEDGIIYYYTENPVASGKSVSFLKKYLSEYYDIELKETGKKNKADLRFCLAPDSSRKEGAYTLSITGEGVELSGYNEPGLFYATQSLIQLLPCDGTAGREEAILLPCAEIYDEPRFSYRGMHLDVVRHIFPVEFVKKYIDYLALHKMNYFHWHLTDDQGWRMESRSHPRLNEYGSYREATIIGIFPGTGVDSTRYGGYYTVEQLKEIVDYAADRYITIVPEIDIPAHSMAILSAYPQFGTEPGRKVKPAITWGIFNRQNNVLAPSEELFSFLEDVFNELMDVFPGKYIHIGCDECAPRWWQESEKVQDFIREHNLGDESGLHGYFAWRVGEIVKKRGRIPVGWDDITKDKVPEGTTVMCWRGVDNGYKAAAEGHQVIMTPSRISYLNRMQRPGEDSLCHRSLTTLEDVYKFDPVPDSIPAGIAENIVGGQGCMWTEYFAYPSSVEYAVFPRMSAIAELYWTAADKKNWPLFLMKMPCQFRRYDLWGASSCKYVFESELIPFNEE